MIHHYSFNCLPFQQHKCPYPPRIYILLACRTLICISSTREKVGSNHQLSIPNSYNWGVKIGVKRWLFKSTTESSMHLYVNDTLHTMDEEFLCVHMTLSVWAITLLQTIDWQLIKTSLLEIIPNYPLITNQGHLHKHWNKTTVKSLYYTARKESNHS